MFERRLKLFLAIICGFTALLLLRALWLQVVTVDYWHERAAKSMERPQLLDTTRGTILDFRGRPIAVDEPCIDAAVDYRAIDLDPEWVKEQALKRLLARQGKDYRAADKPRRIAMVDAEIASLKSDLSRLWKILADEGGRSVEDIEQTKAIIRRHVEMRQRYVWYKKYEAALKEHEQRDPLPWYRDWLLSGKNAPQIDSFSTIVGEQTDAHVILHAVSTETHNRLKKRLEEFPGLLLRPSKARHYYYPESACHVVGRLANVDLEDLKDDPNEEDDLRRYWPNDLIGREGIEALCEPLLRGTRGRQVRVAGRDEIVSSVDPIAGKDVRISIDMELQSQIRLAFEHLEIHGELSNVEVRTNLHGAAIVIDIPTGECRALVSYPTFDPNLFDSKYSQWRRDDLNNPLFNRATMAQFEPGSSIKTVVALGGLTHNYITPTTGIECTGYLVINGHTFRDMGRCWTARIQNGIFALHHPVPIPHQGHDGNPDGFLTVTDALERSCNVFFETLASRMGLAELHFWFDRFGLGRPTGLGIRESRGRIPDPSGPKAPRASTTWFAGIGQDEVTVTPIQMANVVATIARNGEWMRPRLISDDVSRQIPGYNPINARVDLGVSPQALAAVRQGMIRVVNSPSGTGPQARRADLIVGAKTGSAQAHALRLPKRDENGNLILVNGRMQWGDPVPPNSYDWYQGVGEDHSKLAHAWYIGFAPADKPQIAFAVMVEYGGSGGAVAGSVARELLDACVKHGYLVK